MNVKYLSALLVYSFTFMRSYAEISITDEINGSSYNFVSTHSVEISAPKKVVWKNLTDLKSWMYDFDLSHYSGSKGQVGEILRLYPEQKFFVQITSKIPNESLVFSNLPSTYQGERSTGIAVVGLSSYEEKTIVNIVMSRRYTWEGDGGNIMKVRRSSQAFKDQTNATRSRFLEKLRVLSEGA